MQSNMMNNGSTSIKQPTIIKNGKAIEITFPHEVSISTNTTRNTTNSTRTSTFHASWLWIHQCTNYMIPSGQKIHTPGSFDCRVHIHDAQIVIQQSQDDDYDCDYHDVQIGSVHPMKMNKEDSSPKKKQSQKYTLIITWSKHIHNTGNDNTHININSNVNSNTKKIIQIQNEKSRYNLHWLCHWSYDHSSIQNKTSHREVDITNTFLYKFRHEKNQHDNQHNECCDTYHNNDNENETMNQNHRNEKYLGLRHVEYRTLFQKEKDDDNDNDGVFHILDSVFMDGAVLVTDINNSNDHDDDNDDDDDDNDGSRLPASIVGKLIGGGSLSHTSLYGSTFHVQASTNAINIAYTSSYLSPHQDLAYYESKPGLQLLHCKANDTRYITGGESILIDVMAAAYAFRKMSKFYFDILCKCHVMFVKQRDGEAFMTYSRPHIQLQRHYYRYQSNHRNHDDDKENFTKDSYIDEIVSVHWSPPFEGPIQISPEYIESYFQAYAAFELMIDNSIDPKQRSLESGIDYNLALDLSRYAHEYTWEYRLNPGEMIIFNNTRMLHGRREFKMRGDGASEDYDDDCTKNRFDDTPAAQKQIDDTSTSTRSCSKARHLIGAYTNIDDSLNSYRVMLRERNITSRKIPNVGNGTGSIMT